MSEIIVLQHAACEGLGTIQDAVLREGFEVRYVRGDLGEPIPESLGRAAALIVMGGPMGVYEQDRFPYLADELRLIERTASQGQPILGICLGSQLLAASLGATVRKGARKEIGWYPVYLEPAAPSDPLFDSAPFDFNAFHWHGDVFDVPSGAVSLAHSDLTECQAFRAGNSYGILFHMEVTEASVATMVETFPDELRDAGVLPAKIHSETQNHLAALQSVGSRVFEQWVRGVAAREARA